MWRTCCAGPSRPRGRRSEGRRCRRRSLVMTGGGQVDFCAVLGVPRDASAVHIRRAYGRVARRHHPDLNPDPGGPKRLAAAARAYEVLSEPVARARSDQRLLPNRVPNRRSSSRPRRSPGNPPAVPVCARCRAVHGDPEMHALVALQGAGLNHSASAANGANRKIEGGWM
jgi:curved DNA-binding protein CbpA